MNITRIILGMSCREFSEHESRGHDQSVTLMVRLRMAWHRLWCVYCRRLARQWALIREALRREKCAARMPHTVREKIRRKLEAED